MLVLVIFIITVMWTSHAIGSLECDVSRMSSRDTPMTGKQLAVHTAIQGHKSGIDGGDDQRTLLDDVKDEEGTEGEEEMEVT